MNTAGLFKLLIIFICFASVSNSEAKSKDKVVYKKSTTIDFSDRAVDGDFVSPDGRSVKGEKNLYFDSLFENRKNFKKEMKRSSEAVR